jgi:hypothetical protein
MRKGFLCGPVVKKDTENNEATEKKNNPEENPAKDETPKSPTKSLGAIPKTTVAKPVMTDVTNKQKKRRRTRSHGSSLSPSPGRGFFVPGFVEGSKNKSMTLTELMDASKGMNNMALAHEIAVDKDFTLQKIQPANEVERQVKEVMQRAFWDLLTEELTADPPQYIQALTLLQEIKTMLFSILLPQHEKLKEKIDCILDLEVIQQQIDNECLDFPQYAAYILGVMGMLCAPVRDETLTELKNKKDGDVVGLFRGIMELLEQMKLDMANFTIQQVRPVIVSQSVEYERTKFKEFLEGQEDGLSSTRAWLVRHSPSKQELEGEAKYHKLMGQRVLNEGFSELLEWDDYHPLPETLVMDQKRIVDLRDRVERVSVSTAVILLSFSQLNSVIIPMDSQKVKETIKKHTDILLEDFCEDTDLLKILPGVAAQVVKDVDDYLVEKNKNKLSQDMITSLTQQIESLEDPNQKIRDLIQKRIVDFCKQIISGTMKNVQVPPGLTVCKADLGEIAGQFVRLVNYNKSVFGEFYNDIIANHCLFKVED